MGLSSLVSPANSKVSLRAQRPAGAVGWRGIFRFSSSAFSETGRILFSFFPLLCRRHRSQLPGLAAWLESAAGGQQQGSPQASEQQFRSLHPVRAGETHGGEKTLVCVEKLPVRYINPSSVVSPASSRETALHSDLPALFEKAGSGSLGTPQRAAPSALRAAAFSVDPATFTLSQPLSLQVQWNRSTPSADPHCQCLPASTGTPRGRRPGVSTAASGIQRA